MYRNKLLRLLQQLDAPAIRRLRDFVKSPYFKVKDMSQRLLAYILDGYPDFTQAKLHREVAMKHLYGPSGNLNKLRKDQTDLTGHVRRFLAYEALQAYPWRERQLLLDAYEQRGMNEDFFAGAKTLLPEAQAADFDLEPLRFLAEQYQRLFFHPATEKYQPQVPHLEAGIRYLEQYYLLSKFRLLADALLRRWVYGGASSELYVEELQPLAQRHADVPVLCLYAQLLELLSNEAVSPQFDLLVATLEAQIDRLSEVDKRNISAKLMYLGQYYYEKGRLEYMPYMLRIAKLADEKGFVTYQGTITPALYVAIINLAAIAGDFDWSAYFSAEYAPCLLEAHREETQRLGQAYLLFYQGDFQAALKLAADVLKVHPGNRLQAETLLLRLYCELIAAGEDVFDEYERCADRFVKYVRTKALFSPHKRSALLAFIHLAGLLIRFHSTVDRAEQRGIKAQASHYFSQAEAVYSAQWLKQKIEAL
jgi:hypothetical protein